MKAHYLKTVQPHFNEVWAKRKTFELRKNDRNFEVGDIIVLMDYDTSTETYSANEVHGLITHILDSYYDAIHEDYVILSFVEINRLFSTNQLTP